jgi:hypothetical protein
MQMDMLIVRAHSFMFLATLLETTLRTVYPTVKSSVVNPSSEDTIVKSTHACFPHIHPYTKIIRSIIFLDEFFDTHII